ncbi:MAG: YbiU family protein, partial [SAR324 cluster bacterium]|nr:YbiU family protein [SAR324 cluster bacterium]
MDLDQFQEQTVLLKKEFREQHPKFENRCKWLEEKLTEQIEVIEEKNSLGKSTIPELDFHRIENGNVDEGVIQQIKKSGSVVIRNVFPRQRAEAWFQNLEDYVQENDYFSKQKDGLDRYFSDLKSDRPQIYGIYWSKAQIEARQDKAMAKTRSFLNRLWDFESNGNMYFHPDRECTYADRIRMREPGDQSLGLSPHMDAGSVERWLDPAYEQTYSKIFETEWEKYNPYSGAFRYEAE